ncbi:MAG: NIL domain-containing protein, partial [Cyanobacteriota bacterium]
MFKPQLFPLSSAEPDRSMQTQIHLEIPNQYHQEPIISELAKRFNLDVNILAAVLGGNGRTSGKRSEGYETIGGSSSAGERGSKEGEGRFKREERKVSERKSSTSRCWA